MKKLTNVFLFFSLCQITLGQGEIDTQEKLIFQNERSVSLTLSSNGFGAGYRFGKRQTYLNKTIYDIEIAYIRHPKETKVSPNAYFYTTSRRYVNGKLNLFINLRPSIGIQREIFSKEDRGSIAVKYYVGGGPNLGIAKPVYYTMIIGTEDGGYYTIDERYEYVQHPSFSYAIAGRASFWKGMDEISVYPGLHANAGISFEYSAVNRLLNALDISVTIDAFNKKIPIMFTEHNNQLFFTLSLSYRFGWIVDAKYKPPRITKEGQRLTE